MNVTELRDQLITVFQDLREKKIGVTEASEAANVAGKIINSARAQLEYNRYAGSKTAIKFMVGE